MKTYNQNDFPIDAVYMWVNGNDPEWVNKKNKLIAKFKEQGIEIPQSALSPARFTDNQELRYSLRSLEKYAPWIRNVYLVTDNQQPSWIDTHNVHIISHKEIFPPQAAYPVFSNRPIEFCLHRIPSLAEHYLYFNDDFMLGNSLPKNMFFTPSGDPIVWGARLSRRRKRSLRNDSDSGLSPHQTSTKKAHRLIRQHFGKEIPYRIKHYPRAMTRSSVKKLCTEFKPEIYKTIQSPFRTNDDISIFPLYSLFVLAEKLGYLKLINHEGLIADILHRRISHIGASLGDDNVVQKMRRIKRYKPITFCINDAEHATNTDRYNLRCFLNEYFPHKSRFEIDR
jgi:hypothetical protein